MSLKIKLLTERYTLIQGLQVFVPEVSERGFFPEKLRLGIRLPKEMERKFSLHLYRGGTQWAPPPAQRSLLEGKLYSLCFSRAETPTISAAASGCI